MLKQGTLSSRSYAYAYFIHAPSVAVIYYLVIAPFLVNQCDQIHVAKPDHEW
jgi:hypothetical protein